MFFLRVLLFIWLWVKNTGHLKKTQLVSSEKCLPKPVVLIIMGFSRVFSLVFRVFLYFFEVFLVKNPIEYLKNPIEKRKNRPKFCGFSGVFFLTHFAHPLGLPSATARWSDMALQTATTAASAPPLNRLTIRTTVDFLDSHFLETVTLRPSAGFCWSQQLH